MSTKRIDIEIDGVTWEAAVALRRTFDGDPIVWRIDDVTRDGEPWDEPLPAKVRAEIEDRAMRSVSR